MSDEPQNLVLRYLRRIDERMDGLDDKFNMVIDRLSSLESRMTDIGRTIADLQGDVVGVHHRLDKYERRIEKRLDLVET